MKLTHAEDQPKLNCRLPDEGDAHTLEQAVEKLVSFGQRVGVTAEEMISLLDSGIGMQDLLAFLAAKDSGNA
jgi:hypothetical protein